MSNQTKTQNNVFVDIWTSLRALPLWVQIWTMFILAPINMASLFFLEQPLGKWVAFLAIIAMLPNIPLMLKDRGFSKVMGVPHTIPWTILVLMLIFFRPSGSAGYNVYLWLLLVINAISLPFDYTDSWQWFRGNRAVAGREA